MSDQETQYPQHFVDRLEILWGEGFLSPGGAEEVRAIGNGVNFAEKSVLDIGCGTGDVVFSKDAMIHIPDKAAMYREVLIVLKPGGVFAASDWLGGENMNSAAWRRFRELGHLDFTMATAVEAEAMLRDAAFVDVSSVDRNGWYSEVTKQEVRDLEGPLRDRLLEVVDEDLYHHWLEVRRALRDAVNVGALRPTHLRGFRPA